MDHAWHSILRKGSSAVVILASSGGDIRIYKRQRNVNLQKMNQLIVFGIRRTATEKLMKDEYLIWIFIFEMNRFFSSFKKNAITYRQYFPLNTKRGQNESFAIRSSPQTSNSTSRDAFLDKSWQNLWIWLKWITSSFLLSRQEFSLALLH